MEAVQFSGSHFIYLESLFLVDVVPLIESHFAYLKSSLLVEAIPFNPI